jgi:hypothetical protein
MSDENFELMCARLIRLEFPQAFKPANMLDGGADMVLPTAGATYQRCWQAKHYPGPIRWEECKKSLARAKETWKPKRYTFCLPRELTVREQATFDRHFRRPNEDVDVNQWNGEELLARLNGSPEGERVARTFFEDPELDKERLYQAIRAKDVLDNAEDALDRLQPVGAFLRGHDAYFSYSATTHETGQAGPPLTPGTVMSLFQAEGGLTSRIDAVPRDEEALERYAPEVVVQSTPDEKGARAAELLQAALKSGEPVEISEGVEVTLRRAPPAFEELVGKPMTEGLLALGPAEPVPLPKAPPFNARLKAKGKRRTETIDVRLLPAERPPPNFDGALVGSRGALSVEAIFRGKPDGGQIGWNFHYRAGTHTLREQIAALRFLRAAVESGEVTITDRGPTTRPPMRHRLDRSKLAATDMFGVLAFLEDLLEISKWTSVELNVPDLVDYETAYTTAVVAKMIRNRGQPVRWENFETTVDSEGLARLKQGGQLFVDRTLATQIDNRVLQLGFTRIHIEAYKLAGHTRHPDDTHTVRIEPPDEKRADVFEHLYKQANAKSPRRRAPHAARKKGKRRKSRKRGRQ